MSIFTKIKQATNTKEVLTFYGFATKRRNGGKDWVLCPFHSDKNPSMAIWKDGGWKCYVCDAKGSDCVALVAKLFDTCMLDAALRINFDLGLNIEDKPPSRVEVSAYLERKNKEIALDGWVRALDDLLCGMFRIRYDAKRLLVPGEVLWCKAVRELPIIEYWLDIVQFGTNENKEKLLKEIGVDIYDRNV